MIAFPRILSLLAVAATMAVVTACTQPTGLVIVASSPAEDRSLQSLHDDAAITLVINEALIGKQYSDLFAELSTDVYERVVMMTGTVKFAKNKRRQLILRAASRALNASSTNCRSPATTDRVPPRTTRGSKPS